MIYLDNAATSFPKPDCVYRKMDDMNRHAAVNAGRGSYKLAKLASDIITETKDMIRKLVHAETYSNVIFSPSITHALNQIINGMEFNAGSIVYVSPYEHNAVARTLNHIAKYKNLTVLELPINDRTLEIDIQKMKYIFSRQNPDAVFCTHISNVTGYILPIEEIFASSKKYNAINVLDSAQSLGLLDVDVNKLYVDIIAFAGHKSLYGPFGIGGFINVTSIKLHQFIVGGTGSNSLSLEMPSDGEGKYEASSCNIVAVAGLNAALRDVNPTVCYEHEKKLSDYLVKKLSDINKVKMYLPRNLNYHIGIVSFTVSGYHSDDVGMILDEDYDIAVRTGYHCAPFIHKYLRDEIYLGTVRVGLGQFNKKSHVDKLVVAVSELR